jgi:hypothetical protein
VKEGSELLKMVKKLKIFPRRRLLGISTSFCWEKYVKIQHMDKPLQFSFDDAELVHASIYLKNRRNDNLEFRTLNKKFGRLTVLPYVGKKKNRKELFVLTVCDCGKETLQPPYELQTGIVSSCGCARYDKNNYFNQKRTDGNASFKYGSKQHYTNSKYGASKRGYIFTITYEEFRSLILGRQCHYCTNPATGLDRIDNSKGYEMANIIACCKVCNKMKSTLDQEQFLEIIQQIYSKHFAASAPL